MSDLSEFVRVERQSNVHLMIREAQVVLFLMTIRALLEVLEEGGETIKLFSTVDEVIKCLHHHSLPKQCLWKRKEMLKQHVS